MIEQMICEMFARVTGPVCIMAAEWAGLSLGLWLFINGVARRGSYRG
jgi:hypothetical protein